MYFIFVVSLWYNYPGWLISKWIFISVSKFAQAEQWKISAECSLCQNSIFRKLMHLQSYETGNTAPGHSSSVIRNLYHPYSSCICEKSSRNQNNMLLTTSNDVNATLSYHYQMIPPHWHLTFTHWEPLSCLRLGNIRYGPPLLRCKQCNTIFKLRCHCELRNIFFHSTNKPGNDCTISKINVPYKWL